MCGSKNNVLSLNIIIIIHIIDITKKKINEIILTVIFSWKHCLCFFKCIA